jgi:hypothetical protein
MVTTPLEFCAVYGRSGVLTFATTATAAYTVRLYCCDEVIEDGAGFGAGLNDAEHGRTFLARRRWACAKLLGL